ncbi:hypothetical protein [Rhodococcus artemisiae]|uniref:Uncharacterized protein n=1 Tax=Rhodococcus artemisiae TaxID=714159 RepID=A0ABU7L6C8_9NOCA|nr:hypothetical protein [Rhodococcus artemisiae]MEE2057101.1 hypothetical protein [Rhodococcus artemisiae]
MTTRKRSSCWPIVAGAVFVLLVVGAWALRRLDVGPAVGAAEWEADPIGPDDLAG